MPATTIEVPMGTIARLLIIIVAVPASQLAEIMPLRMLVGELAAVIVNALEETTAVTM
jgi:hypothetical protein